jgi:lipopolysaccharide/colanic/teichoic acid biosynthesis glycosyltransferase
MPGSLKKLTPARIYLMSLFEALLAAFGHLVAVYLWIPGEAALYLEYEGGYERIALVTGAFLAASYLFDDFQKRVYTRSRLVLALQLCQLIGILLLFQAGFGFINLELRLSQAVVAIGSTLTLILLMVWRIFLRHRVWNAFGVQQVLFIGYNQAVSRLAANFRDHPAVGMHVMGFLLEDEEAPGVDGVLGRPADLNRILTEYKPERIIVSNDVADKNLLRIFFDLKASGINIETASHAHEISFGRIYSPALDPHTVIFRNDLAARPGSLALQAIYTNLLALAALLIMLPLFLLVAIAIRLSGVPRVLIAETCAGLHGIPFRRYRFRCEGRLGHFLTRFRLAGLPQALNVVRGELAITGPRPENLYFDTELSKLLPFYRQRHHVKPGLIGWSQLHCDSWGTEDTLARLEYDLYYIKHISVVLDAYIVLSALKSFLSRDEEDTVPNASRPVPAFERAGSSS